MSHTPIYFQVRLVNGDIYMFSGYTQLKNYLTSSDFIIADLVKISYNTQNVDNNVIPHRWVLTHLTKHLQCHIASKMKKIFSIGEEIFIDVPLNGNPTEIHHYAQKAGISENEAYDCVCIQNAFTQDDFWKHLENLEKIDM